MENCNNGINIPQTITEPCGGDYISTDCVASPNALTYLDLAAGVSQTQINAALVTALTFKDEQLAEIPVSDGSETKIIAGENVSVTGEGTALSPYTVTALAVESKFNAVVRFKLDAKSSGLLTIGYTYKITTLNGSDNFTNVGFTALNVPFVATGTTPTSWTNATYVDGFFVELSQVLRNTVNADITAEVNGSGYVYILRSASGAFLKERVFGINSIASSNTYFLNWVSANEIRFDISPIRNNNIFLEVL